MYLVSMRTVVVKIFIKRALNSPTHVNMGTMINNMEGGHAGVVKSIDMMYVLQLNLAGTIELQYCTVCIRCKGQVDVAVLSMTWWWLLIHYLSTGCF